MFKYSYVRLFPCFRLFVRFFRCKTTFCSIWIKFCSMSRRRRLKVYSDHGSTGSPRITSPLIYGLYGLQGLSVQSEQSVFKYLCVRLFPFFRFFFRFFCCEYNSTTDLTDPTDNYTSCLRTLWTPRTIRSIRAIRVHLFICEIISVFPFLCPFLLL